jgi:hypothetical protein
VTTRAFDILSANTNTQKFNICEWLIEPTELSMYSTFEMNKKMDIILKSVTKRPEPPLKNLIYKLSDSISKKEYHYICSKQLKIDMKYKRILKLSGEALMGDRQYGIDQTS